jgi:predicted DNA-binding transcriptional regulator AlpA
VRVLPTSSPDLIARKAEVYAGLSALAQELPLEDLSELVGELARAQAIASLRYSGSEDRQKRTEGGLLTVEQVAARLGGISEAQVYRLAKTGLRSAAVDVGEGTLRFDPARVDRFIEARRRE